ncbi:4-hydroxythreonine-4-phosphate dehydrogenase [Ekhidna lutea]|uniref:4-hydroxythreonine-4-phosphate dehydrogenase n=1 Tax=Ekhidna lutea TaxID=447679 RepID=A0A239HK77_EKHLU|nr:4-hydroxythreonine-4-phosphate dehydrogenase PdxA [Ekhidna lutea]SNS81722.1 4-hydroxythreonine-4-phosphate dehydrogenase [Ekhidna lutea]
MSESSRKKNKPVIGITIGDINGIGPEVIIKSLEDNRILKQFTPVIYGSGKVISYYRKGLDKENFNYQQISSIDKVVHKKVNVLNVWDETVEINPGQANEIGGKYAVLSLQKAVADLKEGQIDAIATAPLSKELVQSDDFKFPGHTEYLTQEAGEAESLMFLVHDTLRVGVVTGHIPLNQVSEKVTKEKIVIKLQKMIKSLQKDFGIKKPKVAVLGLNPHAGENSLLGDEEEKVIIPAINEVKSGHHIVMGPFPADGFFGMKTYKQYDGVLAMYHDQGLIPFKTLAFEEGINYTAGLPFVRTSPDHGTAFAIAGKNEADETSFRNALYLANDIIRQRNENQYESADEK